MIFDRIAIGTANWGKPYRGNQFPRKDIPFLLRLARAAGIDTIETADDYGCYDIIKEEVYQNNGDQHWNVVRKVDPRTTLVVPAGDRPEEETIISHTEEFYGDGATYYRIPDTPIPRCGIANVPYSMFNQEWDVVMRQYDGPIFMVRSVYHGGKAFMSPERLPEKCLLDKLLNFESHSLASMEFSALAFVLMNPNVDLAVVGFDDFAQFASMVTMFSLYFKMDMSGSPEADLRG